jgi:Na+-driven multidrug efflux pump/anti-sigma regulatory factor (Ser/Thr protein kinase)
MCIDYLRGTAAGLPAMTAMAILTRGVQIEGSPKIAVRSVTVMAAMNALGDIICAAIPGADLLGITIVTSISYYAGVAVLLQYYRKPDVLLKPSIKGLSFKETLVVNNIGVWGGVIGLISGLTLVLRADILNIAIDLHNVENTGLQAYSTQVQLNYIVNAFQNSAISIMFLLGAVCKAEEDRVSFKRIMAQIIKYDVISATVISIVVYCFADGLAWLYLGNAGKEVLGTSAGVLRACAVGIVFQMVVLLLANYLQVFGHNILAILIIITSNVFVPLFGASYGAEIAKLLSTNIVVGVFGGLAALHVISALLLPLLIPVVNRRFHGRDLIWMMPENFGTLPENELRAVITKQSEVVKFSQQAWDFCIDKGEPQRIAYLTALAIEEMAMNVLEHGFDEDGRKHILSIRLVNKEDELILRFRDDTPRLDPREEYESVFNKEDESRMIGLKMIMEEAKDVRYTSMLHLNNLVIRIDTRL